ncbi:right-handed parallel beta-helix repeat-containing protein [Paenibacillus sp. strain BS8-2]
MAILEVYPGHRAAIQDAVDAANEGDLILVHPGIYDEHVRISGMKNNLRIVAKHKHGAVLDGRNIMREAFVLDGVAGVEIDGLSIQNYMSVGIRIIGGKSHRILENEIRAIRGRKNRGRPSGIMISLSTGNLLLRNKITRIGRRSRGVGIRIQQGSSANWVIQNVLNRAAYGIVVYRGQHNAVIGNRIEGSRYDGILTSESDNTLIYDNNILANRRSGVRARSTNNLIIDGRTVDNDGNGLSFESNYNLAFNNEVSNNKLSGVAVGSDFNDIQSNRVENNSRNGVWIRPTHTANFVFDNHLRCNTPQNVKNQGIHNIIIRNHRG